MIIIFDLDYTLLDTEKLKKDIAVVFNMGAKQFNEDCQKFFINKKIKYNPYSHIRFLKKEKRISSARDYGKKIDSLVKSMDKYLYPKVLDVIKKFKKKGDKLILMSVGDKIKEIIEFKDADDKEKATKEVNPGFYFFDKDWLWANIGKLENKNAQKEYYLTDLIKIASQQSIEINSMMIDLKEAIGINNKEELEIAEELIK